jgi:hypothetical protein
VACTDQEELGEIKTPPKQKPLCWLIDDYISHLKRDHDLGSFGAPSPSSIRHQQVVLAGFFLWIQANLQEVGE